MLQQMLHDDKEAEVREAVVRSLGLLMGFISDPDKYQQVCHKATHTSYIKIEIRWRLFRSVFNPL